MPRKNLGFTLIELLISISLVGLLSLGLASIAVFALSAVTKAKQVADAVEEMAIINHFMADYIREADYIYPNSVSFTTSNLSLLYNIQLTCELNSLTNPCLAITRPKYTSNAGSKLDSCEFIAYRYGPRSELKSPSLGVGNTALSSLAEDTWADSHTWYLAEYRRTYPLDTTSTTGSQAPNGGLNKCATNRPSALVALTNVDGQLLMDYADPSNRQPFGISGNQVSLRLRQRRLVLDQDLRIPDFPTQSGYTGITNEFIESKITIQNK